MKIAVGINKPDSGTILINNSSPFSPKTRENIGFMPEEPRFYNLLTGYEFLLFINQFFSPQKRSSLKEIDEILKKMDIYNARDSKIKTYSKGMKQRLSLAQSLLNNPDYLFLDEPLESLDPVGRKEIKTMIIDLKKQGKTIFFNSHILSDIENICDQIGIIHKGQLIYSGPVNEFKKDQTLEEKFVETIKNIS